MAKFLVTQTVDRAAIDRDAKSELVQIGEVVEITDVGTIEKYVGNGTFEPVADEEHEPLVLDDDTSFVSGALGVDGAIGVDPAAEPVEETKEEVQQQSPDADPSGTSAE